MILIKNKVKKIKIDTEKIKTIIKNMLQTLEYQDFDLGILFTTNKTIKKYNNIYRKKNKATDILSFPYHTTLKSGERIKILDQEDKNLGDIIISLEFAQKDAKKLNISLDTHLKTLFTHGIAHLLGYDHKTEFLYQKMHKFEQKLLKNI